MLFAKHWLKFFLVLFATAWVICFAICLSTFNLYLLDSNKSSVTFPSFSVCHCHYLRLIHSRFMWFTGAAVEPLPMQDVFSQQRRCMLQTSSDTEQDTSPPPDVHRQLCANITSQQQQQRVAKLHLAIDMEAHQLGVRLPIQNIIKPVDSSAVDDRALVAPVSLPDFCSDWDL